MAKLLLRCIFICCLYMTAWSLNSTVFLSMNKTITWTNNDNSFSEITHFNDGSIVRFILLNPWNATFPLLQSAAYGCGFFYKQGHVHSCNFVIFIVETSMGHIGKTFPPQVVWSANDGKPVGENATLTLSNCGDMILPDGDGTIVWAASISGMSISGLRISKNGNLMIFDQTNGTIWQSFNHPTDTLLVGQTMRMGQLLTPSMSSMEPWHGHGLCYFSLDSFSLSAYVVGQRRTRYLSFTADEEASKKYSSLPRIRFDKDFIIFFFQKQNQLFPIPYSIPNLASIQLLRLDADGGLRIYGWDIKSGWTVVHVFLDGRDECQFPLKCGTNGLCKDGQCSCLRAADGKEYFTLLDNQSPNFGCQENVASFISILLNPPTLVDFGNLSYFGYFDEEATVPFINNKEECNQNCIFSQSCRAVFFYYRYDSQEGKCYLLSTLLTTIGNPMSKDGYKSSAFIKVITPASAKASPQSSHLMTIVSALIVTFALISVIGYLSYRKFLFKTKSFEPFSEIPISFTYHELYAATKKFSEELGRGGFGSVFKGALKNGTIIAIKRLDNMGQGMKEFLAEVETIGTIHHINLVKLIGFCADKSHRLLVYEYMSNGSLDKWIFSGSTTFILDWDLRHKIILDIAKALVYLHEDCRQRIAHLDVKPHNILLDSDFNAKLSDFGLSKLIDRDQSNVMTSIRGTLGYAAPEWQHSRITVKADVYSNGIVLMEVVSARKNLDYSKPEPDVHLLRILQTKAEENRLIDIVEYQGEDRRCHDEEVLKMIRLGMWCLS